MNVDNKQTKVKTTTTSRGQARITCPPLVAKNLDKLKISFWVDWKDSSFLDELGDIKKSIQKTSDILESPYYCPGGFNWNVNRTGTKRFTYRLSAGDIFLLVNTRSCTDKSPNVSLEIGSESCWSPGFKEIYHNFTRWIQVLGGDIFRDQISEVHMAADLIGQSIDTLNIGNKHHWITRSDKFTFNESARQLETFNIGKGDIMLRIYDKVLELKKSPNKQALFSEAWGVPYYDHKPVTRIEFQLRRKILKDIKTSSDALSGIDTYEELCDSLQSIWFYCTHEWVQHCSTPVDRANKHQSRAKLSPIWELISSIQWEGNTVRTRETPRPKKDYVALRKQYLGICMTLAAFHDVNTEDVDTIIDIGKHIIEEDIVSFYINETDEFTRRIDKKKREIYESISPLHNLKPDHPSSYEYPTPYLPFDKNGEPYV